jgi:hypothetical protein
LFLGEEECGERWASREVFFAKSGNCWFLGAELILWFLGLVGFCGFGLKSWTSEIFWFEVLGWKLLRWLKTWKIWCDIFGVWILAIGKNFWH